MSPRIKTLSVENLRSIAGRVSIRFPDEGPLVILGENNSGKSNLTRAIDIMFGERWPASIALDDHDFHGRDPDGLAVSISAVVEGLKCSCSGEVQYIRWTYDPQRPNYKGDPVDYSRSCTECHQTFMSKELRSALYAMSLDADRRLTYQLSYTNKFTLLSRLMRRFHDRLLSDPGRRQRLEAHFHQLVEEFNSVPEFGNFRQTLTQAADDLGQNLNYRLDVDFSAYDPSNFFRSLRVHPTFAGAVRSFDELGTGQEQILALAFALSYAQAFGQTDGLVLVIDEPEAHLHPLAQQWLALRLNKLTTDGLQVVVTTHSPHFVDLSRPENLVLLRRPSGRATEVVQLTREEMVQALITLGAHPTRTTTDSVGPFYEASVTNEIRSAFFSRACVLVEGQTEALAFPELLKRQGFDSIREGVAFVPTLGIGSMAKWARLMLILGIPTYCIFDTDSDKSGRSAGSLQAQLIDLLSAISGVEPNDLMSEDAIWVGQTHSTLAPNFEGAMRVALGKGWEDAYTASVQYVGDSKPLRARFAAQHYVREQVLPPTPIDALARALRSLVSAARDSGTEGSHDDSEYEIDYDDLPDAAWDEAPF